MTWPWNRLSDRGILGINARDHMLQGYKITRELREVLDDKALTRQHLLPHGLGFPTLYASASDRGRRAGVLESLEDRETFVIKPARGSGGRGILILEAEGKGCWRTPGGGRWNRQQIIAHFARIQAGFYSLSERPDTALVEERIGINECYRPFLPRGLPDIRVILLRQQPVMAMCRIPTNQSDGRANLHQGAVGVGLCLVTGRASGGVLHDRAIRDHPDVGLPFEQLRLTEWDSVLRLAVRAAEAIDVPYVGVDIVLDPARGPLLLELNRQPGLSIQIANRAGLRPRIGAIDRGGLR